ncbi:MAG: transcriptional regulator [Tessaracoccus sp.]
MPSRTVTHSPVLPATRLRDLTLLGIDDERVLIVACDSTGSIGPKKHDSYAAPARVVAHFALRVPLLEVIAAGGRVELIVDALSVELVPTGLEMIEEIRRVAALLGLGADRITGSTEDNVLTAATGVGVTVIGTALRSGLRPGSSRDDDIVLCLGQPTSAPQDEIVMDDPRMITLETLSAVLEIDGVHDALPVGSKGVAHELGELATLAGLVVEESLHEIDVTKSGGPASCVLVSVSETSIERLQAVLPAQLPVAMIARLRTAL